MALVLLLAGPAAEASAWRGPLGWEVYRQLDTLPRFRSATQTIQTSSYDRTGGNDDGFNGTYSCPRSVAAGCVIAERRGAGQIESIWFTRDLGDLSATGRIRVELDGRTAFAGRLANVVRGALGPPFVLPLVASAGESSGGGYIRVPLPFRRSMRVITQNNPDFYHVIFRTFRSGQGLPAFERPRRVPLALRRAGRADPKRRRPTRQVRARFRVEAGRSRPILRLSGAGSVTELALRMGALSRLAPAAAAEIVREARLRISFDGRLAVDAPLGEFFGSGWGPSRVRALMFAMGPRAGDWMRAWWPMPYGRSVSISLRNPTGTPIEGGMVRLTVAPSRSHRRALARGSEGYFRATATGPAATTPAMDWPFLDVRGRGTFVGVVQTAQSTVPFYMEGDERAYVDDRTTPSFHGTGTEDFYEGGWYFEVRGRARRFTLPVSGFTAYLTPSSGCPLVDCRSAYRLMLADAIPFQRSLRFGIEHGAINSSNAIYSSTAFWYERVPG